MLYILNLHSAVWQLYLIKLKEKIKINFLMIVPVIILLLER